MGLNGFIATIHNRTFKLGLINKFNDPFDANIPIKYSENALQKENLIPNIETEGWDGFSNNKKMQSGVYIYVAEIEFIDGETEIFKGDITLIE